MSPITRRETLRIIAGAGAVGAGCSKSKAPGTVHQSAQTPHRAAILSVEPLVGAPWPTLDPFLFCVHHDDDYPVGNEQFGPATSLEGRQLGSDFGAKDGFSMYHGRTVPGFPQHPHRGFETVTVVRQGLLDHADSLGARARYGKGDVQWLTAGAGIIHSEMFPLLNRHQRNPVELFQIWLNLPRKNKLVAPHFKMLWSDGISRRTLTDDQGRHVHLTFVTGSMPGSRSSDPPPNSWAARAENEVAIWTIRMDPGAEFALPVASSGVHRALYYFRGNDLRASSQQIGVNHRIVASAQAVLRLQNGPEESELLMLQGRPIGEPIVKHGPFVMNTREEIEGAISDYQRTRFGGWPWPSGAPVHGALEGRFAARPGQDIERPG